MKHVTSTTGTFWYVIKHIMKGAQVVLEEVDNYSQAMLCDVGSKPLFCRACCCNYGGKTVFTDYGGYSFVYFS